MTGTNYEPYESELCPFFVIPYMFLAYGGKFRFVSVFYGAPFCSMSEIAIGYRVRLFLKNERSVKVVNVYVIWSLV